MLNFLAGVGFLGTFLSFLIFWVLNIREIMSVVGKRFVYTSKRINKIGKKELIDLEIIKSHPQSTQSVNNNYEKLKKLMET